ncbi:MAG TPA: ABC transporter substrate-binding protein [Stellaceae bacterium]|jgi:NitT/TauT family transport system substrate-binding protein|nr:ABC transporter substrate-binding protein [Stellaceae bacterium]
MRLVAWFVFGLMAVGGAGFAPAQAETVKVGLSKLVSYPGVPIALARGYFKQQGLDVEMVFFDSAQPISVGVASGDIQFGVAGLSASFYTLAGQGQLKLVASSAGEEPGFYNLTFVASNKAYDSGLKSVKDLPGRDVAITQLGTSLHYAIGLAAEKYGFAMNSFNLRPLQSNSNVIAALTGGTIAVAVMRNTPTLTPVAKGEIKRIAWVGDITPDWMGSALFSGTKTLNGQGDMVKRFLTAYRQGTRDYHDAFSTSDDKRKDGPDAPAVLKILADFAGVSAQSIDEATPYLDRDARVNVGDVAHQISWYKSQGLLKGEVKAEDIVDTRYATTTPAK